MPTTPADRLARLARNARSGLAMARSDPGRRQEVLARLRDHPSPRADVDALWRAALDDSGPLARWLREDGDWCEEVPLHTVLSSHPFPMVSAWSIQEAFRAS